MEHLDDREKRALVRTSFDAAIQVAMNAERRSFATPVLQGGWRLAPEVAFTEMLKTPALGETNIRIEVACIDGELAQRLQGLAQALGFGR